jgi:putative hydrolase of HD superfamily
MKNLLKFFLETSKLKEMPRTGWVWLEVKNPETIAEHIFRMSILCWLLAKEKGLNIKRAIEIALFHDLCEVYSGDMTPYFDLLPKNRKKRKEILKRWIRLPQKDKIKRAKKKFKIEKYSLLKLLRFLEPRLRKEIFALWLDYEKGISKEGHFVKQVDKIETMIQAIEYFGTGKDTPVTGWWEEVEELVVDPLLCNFLKVIEKKLYYKKSIRKFKKLENILGFLLKIGKLKRMPRRGWVLRGVKNPETVAAHIFGLSLTTWLLSKKIIHDKKLDEGKLLRMALCHELCEVYAGDMTPYESCLSQGREVFRKWIRFSREEKRKVFLKDFQKEKKALKKLLKGLPQDSKKEFFYLWEEFKKNKTKEARILNQIYALETLLQALLYWKRDKSFPIKPWWEWAFEIIEQNEILSFLEEVEKKFLK